MRRVLILAGALAALLAVALAAFLLTFDANRYKDRIARLVEARTGRSFAIDGAIGLKLSLLPTLTVEGARLGNADWAQDADLLVLARVEARAALLPLLRGELALERLVAGPAELNLEHNADGEANWQLAPLHAPAAAAPPAEGLAAGFETVTLRAVRIRYRQPGRERPLELGIEQLDLEAEHPTAPLSLALEAQAAGQRLDLNATIESLAALRDGERLEVQASGALGALALELDGSITHPRRLAGLDLRLALAAPSLAGAGALLGAALPPLAPARLEARLSDARGTAALEDLRLRLGGSDAAGHIVVTAMSPRSHIELALASERLDLRELLPAPAPQAEPRARLLPAASLPLAALRAVDLDARLQVAALRSRQLALDDLALALTLENGKLEISELTAGLAGGRLEAALAVDAAGATARVKHHLAVTGLQPGRLPRLAGRDVLEGAATDLELRIASRGNSVAALMAAADGRIHARVGPGRLRNKAVGIGSADWLMTALKLLNPLAERQDYTRVECAAFRFPIAGGVAANDTGIALQTRELAVLGGGRIDFSDERLAIAAKPKPREGIGLNIASLADFVRIGGTLARPRLVTDAAGAATGAAKIGAAVATGGLSILAEGLFDRGTAGGDVCATVLAAAARQGAGEVGALERTRRDVTEGVKAAGEGVKRVLEGLFGD